MKDSNLLASLPPSVVGGFSPGSLTFSQILERVFQLLRNNLCLFLGVALAPFALLLLAIGGIEVVFLLPLVKQMKSHLSPEFLLSHLLPMFLVMTVLSVVIYAFYFGAAAYAATSADKGVKITIKESYREAWQRLGRYVFLFLLMCLLAFLPFLLLLIPICLASISMVYGAKSTISVPFSAVSLLFLASYV